MKVKVIGEDKGMEVLAYIACNNTPVAICRQGEKIRSVELSALEIIDAQTYREHMAEWPEKGSKTGPNDTRTVPFKDKITGEIVVPTSGGTIHPNAVDPVRDAVHKPSAPKNDGKKK